MSEGKLQMLKDSYGKELILDIYGCNPDAFTRETIEKFMIELCDKIQMVREDLHFWDEVNVPEEDRNSEAHLIGTSAVQFIRTSNITIHTLDILKRVYLNIFSCKDYDTDAAVEVVIKYFGGMIVNREEIVRV